MIYSLSEIDAQVKKAVRGAGFEWGCAEEAGKAVRLLAAYQLPGAAVLANYLTRRAKQAAIFQQPRITGRRWQAGSEDGVLCPLISASCLCDRGVDVLSGALLLERVASPLLLCPYLVLMSRVHGCALALSWPGVQLTFYQGRISGTGVADDVLMSELAEWVECAGVRAADAKGIKAGKLGQDIDAAVWAQLDEFAKRTYVAATETSRRGAGPAD